MPMYRPKILVVDDEPYVRDLFERLLESEGYEVATEGSGFRAMVRIYEEPFDLVFLDILMPGLDGVRTVEELRNLRPECDIVMITGHAEDAVIQQALDAGASCCLRKPIEVAEILFAVEAAEKRTMEKRAGYEAVEQERGCLHETETSRSDS